MFLMPTRTNILANPKEGASAKALLYVGIMVIAEPPVKVREWLKRPITLSANAPDLLLSAYGICIRQP